MARPRLSGKAEKEIDRIEDQLSNAHEANKSATSMDAVALAPVAESEPQTQLSKKQVEQYDAPVIKPSKSFPPNRCEKRIPGKESEIARGKERVKVVCENKEQIGQNLEFWTKFWPGEPCDFWVVPVNVPVYLPRQVADHLSNRFYSRFRMNDKPVENAEMCGQMVVEERMRRIDCRPAGFGF